MVLWVKLSLAMPASHSTYSGHSCFTFQIIINASREVAEACRSSLATATHMEEPDDVLDPWLSPDSCVLWPSEE